MSVSLSVLDLSPIAPGATAQESIHALVALAQHAERHGYKRVWYSEHHNTPTIASSAPAVLTTHVAAHTSRIRLGAGGVMLPTHVPLLSERKTPPPRNRLCRTIVEPSPADSPPTAMQRRRMLNWTASSSGIDPAA
ncbi:LLM class flavin-dependent oxidoreductase [Microbacterium oleivorans]|uniref:LLM class flavin-dependent oxidoreductase n=1 Tax=Microbacterium oleivorans TaxID=273677 RepID=A0A4R5YJZ3_9MICO|nr:LLM class flavin-dependent oxidoreductase [Microbacterium oleivorans]